MKKFFTVTAVLMIAMGSMFASVGDVRTLDAYDAEFTEIALPDSVIAVLEEYGFDASLVADGVDVSGSIDREIMRIDYLSDGAVSDAAKAAVYNAVAFQSKGPSYLKIGKQIWYDGLTADLE